MNYNHLIHYNYLLLAIKKAADAATKALKDAACAAGLTTSLIISPNPPINPGWFKKFSSENDDIS